MKIPIVLLSPLLVLASPAFSPALLSGQGTKVARGENYCCNPNIFFFFELKTYTGPDKLTTVHSGAQTNHAQFPAVDMANVTLPAVPVVVDAAIYEAVLGKAPGPKLHVIYGLI
ncbi:LOW QUALITY PROTEIN: hypothetical protein H112_08713 [Trichophyton rubrum D6]|uniref:Uncharacterized protein n=2 Tax=Trichophyton rubrum TaxID=5551 RepID=A0A080WEE4_TRIRC|nr:LOW QUALITY PROTEIN: uncharacterized protein TERG_11695 [Trichophyton rubrum CBS 118892]EZF09984.1 LOW QUALITY PROTEIN: hypothetical protein H100_08735 [Trichophyton rubrum MR850]EZF36838.1 LOW QUALITY PROTEIN: hypothetical protein H102_08694 [Trichophyton rubrum CBS 100081]EZF47433.1 LOW QUALITY PROTEIN: hypothetical protein H103_08716 [Trichophyton rubrum CBS 288.86]EZF58091.1 LOW QUALITY PROTEIN: hypothetical protein H104_08668 [Trichophyton rubrum CBS 289.86]EZF79392.1 LOW QUALITY PROTE